MDISSRKVCSRGAVNAGVRRRRVRRKFSNSLSASGQKHGACETRPLAGKSGRRLSADAARLDLDGGEHGGTLGDGGRLVSVAAPGSRFSTASVCPAATSGPKRRCCNVHQRAHAKRRGPTVFDAATGTFVLRAQRGASAVRACPGPRAGAKVGNGPL
jgi:hypothetical protein